jgi:hypothetical protein
VELPAELSCAVRCGAVAWDSSDALCSSGLHDCFAARSLSLSIIDDDELSFFFRLESCVNPNYECGDELVA